MRRFASRTRRWTPASPLPVVLAALALGALAPAAPRAPEAALAAQAAPTRPAAPAPDPAAPAPGAPDRRTGWGAFALGIGSPTSGEDDGFMAGSLTVQREVRSGLVVGGRGTWAEGSEFCLFSACTVDRYVQVAGLLGVQSRAGWLTVSAHTGLSLVFWSRSGGEDRFDPPPPRRFSPGLPLEARVALHPARWIGLSGTLLLDVNGVQRLPMLLVGVEVGRFR